jgi:cellulose synthase/poly-beta-1,6-N-acetylglucosamine synthase-like glycosyltransferase
MVLLYITISLFAGYSVLILYYWLSWRSVPEFFPGTKNFTTTVSVIIPARNEEENIAKLLNAIQNQTYPQNLSEIIVVNDHSTDHTVEIVKQFPGVFLIDLKDDSINSYKKKALEQGINAASNLLIITTDADCIPPSQWLESIVSFREQNNSVFIAGPVVLQHNSSTIQIFQALDFLVLQGITAASVHKQVHSMCNGANIAYEKQAFDEVNGFEGIDKIASGDDMLLMHKIWKKFPERVHYLKSKEAIVSTQPMKTWKEFFNQRIRWASKARFYNDARIFWVLLLVYFFNLSLLILLIAGIWNLKFVIWFFLFWFAKTVIEFPFVYSVAKFFNKKSLLRYFFFFQPLHIIYTIIAGWLGQFGSYEWKGRKVK